jgi:hypothetical protein
LSGCTLAVAVPDVESVDVPLMFAAWVLLLLFPGCCAVALCIWVAAMTAAKIAAAATTPVSKTVVVFLFLKFPSDI